MKTMLIAVATLAALSSNSHSATLLDSPDGIPPEIAEQMVNDVSDLFADPTSVQIRRIHFAKNENQICGQYNAKNAYGGYVGFKMFKYIVDRRKTYISVSTCR